MTTGISLTAAIQPHEIPKAMRDGFDDLVRRVVVAATIEGCGHDLLLRVYLAGMNHGLLLGLERRARPAGGTERPDANGEERGHGG